MRAVPDLIRTWMPRRYVTLGTDGYGRSDTRAALRSFFEVDRHHVTVAALKTLTDEGSVERAVVAKAIASYNLGTEKPNPWTASAESLPPVREAVVIGSSASSTSMTSLRSSRPAQLVGPCPQGDALCSIDMT